MGLRESVIFDWAETLQPSSRKTSFAPLKSIWGYPAYWRGLYRAKAGPQYEGILELPASVFLNRVSRASRPRFSWNISSRLPPSHWRGVW
jgi:hypothetical protein